MVSIKASYCSDNYEHPLSDIMYIVSNIPGIGSQEDDFESPFSVGCVCSPQCKDNCSCTNGTQNYNDLLLSVENDKPIIECNFNCTCNENCGNRLVQHGPLDCLSVRKATIDRMGFGLFTTKLIKKGQFICEYAGEVIGTEEAYRRIENNKTKGLMNYVFVLSEHIGCKKITTCIDPSKFGNIGRYSNHSCEPNTVLIPVRIDTIVPRLCLFAKDDIQPMDEITFNYAGDVGDSVQTVSDTPCLCGSVNCLGHLPHCPV